MPSKKTSTTSSSSSKREEEVNQASQGRPLPPGIVNNASEHQEFKKYFLENKSLIEDYVNKLSQNAEGIEEDALNMLKNKLEALLRTAAKVEYEDSIFDTVVGNVLTKYNTENLHDILNVDKSIINNEIIGKVEQKGNDFDVRNDAKISSLLDTLLKTTDEDEELMVLEEGMSDAQIKCPVTAKFMIEPMKKYVFSTLIII
jgi:hypothetical protein